MIMASNYEDRTYVIFNTSELNLINFSEVLESSDTIRKSVDETKTFVKWCGDVQPNCISSLTIVYGTYSYSQILTIMSSAEWYQPISL